MSHSSVTPDEKRLHTTEVAPVLVRPPRYRRRGFRRLFVPIAMVVAVGIAAVSYTVAVIWLLRSAQPPRPGPSALTRPSPPQPACPSHVISTAARARLGTVAWVQGGTLRVVDLATCRQGIVVASGASAPVRFSPDGRWVAFGEGRVVPATGGAVQEPLGSPVPGWEWSATADVLAGVTAKGGVVIAAVGGAARTVLPDGSGVGHLAFAPDGRRLALDRAGTGIQALDVATGAAHTILPEPDRARAPRVAGWSADGRWILYWRGPVGTGDGPLDAVPASGGGWVNLWGHVLPYSDFLSTCGDSVAITAGSGTALSGGKQIFLSVPPAWQFRDLTNDPSRSWFWPACSPNGRWVAVIDTLDQPGTAGQAAPRALWLLASHGSSRRILVPGFQGAPEYPRWSSDGSVILVVLRSGTRWSSPGNLFMVRISPTSGRLIQKVGPIADLGSAPGPGGHQGWASISDWYRR